MRALPILAAGALCALGCSQQAIPPPAHIVGTNSVVQVNDLLFVTSPGASELRALNLKASPRDFVRAPNPLEPLSIPVLNGPTTLARDIEYNQSGDIDDTIGNPYIYVQGAASAEISIVGTQRDTQLVELRRVVADGIVTAIAARGPTPSDQTSPLCRPSLTDQTSTLYYATLNGTQGRLWQLCIPSSDPTGRMGAEPYGLTSLSYGPAGGESGRVAAPISSIAVLPNNRIAVASRALGTAVGRTILLDTSRRDGTQWELSFPPGTAVRQLVTHPTVYRTNDDGSLSVVLPAGARLFGVLDDDSCGSVPDCPGILAVDTLSSSPQFGRRSLDVSGYPMVPIRYGGGLISALSLAPLFGRTKPGVSLAFPGQSVHTIDLLGTATTSNGLILFFDAVALSVFNVRGTPPQATSPIFYLSNTGDAQPYVPGPVLGTQIPNGPQNPDIKVALGAAVDETVSITFQGTIPGFRDVPVPGPGVVYGQTVLAPGGGDLRRVMAGADRIVVVAGDCTAEVPLTTVGPVQDDRGPVMLQTTQPITCAGAATFSVRADGNQPYVVEGSATGYMGRTGNSQTFAFPPIGERAGRYYYHQATDPSRPELAPYNPTVPQLQFSMGSGDSNIRRDYRYTMTIDSGYEPEYVVVDTGIGVEFHTPGSSAYAGALPDGTDISRLYVAYPSANALVEFAPQLLTPNRPNARYLGIFR